MTRITTVPMAFALAALLLAGCATKKPEEAPMAAPAPAPAPDPTSMMASADAKPILLSDKVMPEGGKVIGVSGTGTPLAGVSGWAVHGDADGVAWRYGPGDGGFIHVAGKAGVDWQYIQVGESWAVQCRAEADNKTTHCSVLRIQPLQAGNMASGGVALDEHLTCVRTDSEGEDAEITVDSGQPHILPAATRCISGAESDALQQEMLAGTTIQVKAHFQPKGPPQTLSLPTYGLKQAMTLRGWIVDKYKSGDLSTMPE
jgi:hypothetical protein